MTGIQCLACLWTLLIMQTGFVCSEIQLLERHEGETVVLPCVVEQKTPPPYGAYLKRSWLHPTNVLFMYTKSAFAPQDDAYKARLSVSGDPSGHALNVTISRLRPGDTDRYHCEFVVNRPSAADERVRGETEFFLLVTAANAYGSADIGLVEACAGGSAVLPCLPPSGESLAVEGVSLKRRKGQAPVETVYHSKGQRGSGAPPSSSSSSSSQFPAERVQLSSAPGPAGITYNLTLQQLQPDDSALYSCQLLVRGRSDAVAGLGRRAFFVSVQGSDCSCSNYSILLYVVSTAVAVLLLLVVIGLVMICQGKAHHSVKPHPQAPIYEEMVGVKSVTRKLAPCHLEEAEATEYTNCSVKKSCQENHYESPSGALCPRKV